MQMVKLSENVVVYLMGEGEDGWQSLLDTHFFVLFIVIHIFKAIILLKLFADISFLSVSSVCYHWI